MTDLIHCDTTDGVRTLRFNRADKKNALTAEMYAALAAAIGSAESEPVGAIVLLGQPGVFSAGNDVSEFIAMARSGAAGGPIIDFLRALATATVPLVAGVDGLAIGVGTTMLFHCDHVLASSAASFRTPFTDLGLVPEAGSSLVGPALMGHQLAFELLVAGQTFDAARACQAGFVNRIVASAELEAETLAFARMIAGKPRGAVRDAKRLLRGDSAARLERIDEELAIFAQRLTSPEAREAFAAFLARKG